jgi:hypothetical protein
LATVLLAKPDYIFDQSPELNTNLSKTGKCSLPVPQNPKSLQASIWIMAVKPANGLLDDNEPFSGYAELLEWELY